MEHFLLTFGAVTLFCVTFVFGIIVILALLDYIEKLFGQTVAICLAIVFVLLGFTGLFL